MKLLLVIIEGQLYLAGVLAIFVAELAFLLWGLWSRRPIIGLIAVFATVPLMRSTLSTIRACIFRIGAPEGLPLDRSEGRALYAFVDETRRAMDAPPVDGITITSDFNAGAASHLPPWRLRRHRTLVLGLPVLATLSILELRAVVAHELAHFSGGHDPFSAWVYRTRRSWFALRQSLDQRLATPLYVYWLIRWYVPRLRAASAAVVRRHEFAADQVAAGVAGSRAAADALVVLEAGARFADETYWPAIRTSHETDAAPPRPYARMLIWNARLSSREALTDLFTRDATPADSHPSLGERFAGLGEDINFLPPAAPSAGEEILGGTLETLAGRLDQEWLSRNGDAWHQHRAEYLEEKGTLERLTAIETPTPEDLFKRAELVESLNDSDEGSDASLPIYQRAAEQGHAPAKLAAGRLLLHQRDATGIALVEDAMDRDESLVPQGCRILAAYYTDTHQELAARKCEWRATRHTTRVRLAQHGQTH
jgi:Zn-dependent protease with chaperone function